MAAKGEPQSPVDAYLSDVDRLRDVISRVRTPQIRSGEDRGHIKAVAAAWFKTYKGFAAGKDVTDLDSTCGTLLVAAEKLPSSSRVKKLLKGLRKDVIDLQADLIAAPSPAGAALPDVAPSFAAVPDAVMRQILTRRWDECVVCIRSGAPLAGIVMMGGLLESLFLARVNREPNLKAVFTAKACPKDKATGNPRQLKEWGLGDFIAVAHDLGWITQSGKDVSAVLQNYRNFIHPQKELASQAALTLDDARMLWVVAKEIAIRLL
jgi:hypothetical protein